MRERVFCLGINASPTIHSRHRHRQLGLSGSLALICSLQLLDLSLTGGHRPDPHRARVLDRPWYPSSAPLHRLQPHRSSYAECRCQWTSPIRSTMSLNGVSVGGSWCYVVSMLTSYHRCIRMPTRISNTRLPSLIPWAAPLVGISGSRVHGRLPHVDFAS